MGCTSEVLLENITFTCADKPKGGIDDMLVIRASDITTATDTDGELDITAVEATSVARIDFNKKDGFSYAGTDYAGEADGTDSYTPTVAVQLPKITKDKLHAAEQMLGGFNELVVFVRTRAGEELAYGFDNGLYGGTMTSTTGTNTDKNMIELSFTGDEDSFERELSDDSWAVLEAALVV